ncbi:hypothetical protein F2Q68_00042150 [Brassica cretica]|uniref:DC1 domain-containing protein n=1 Tax=Brassica cretica TaxID=69181 RepID=A0A8S9MH48_BRACR|nr:hypothetical protein F2Q68_00042150 [Brassica cretica]
MFKREEVAPRCRRLSDPAHPHTLCRRDNPRPSLCFRCGPVNENDEDYDWNNIHYYCEICKLVFHEDCYMFPQGTRHPYHPHHPIYMTIRFSETRMESFKYGATEMASFLTALETTSTPMLDENAVFETNNACHWCGNVLGLMFFRCLDCDFSLGAECMWQDPPFTIINSGSHEHPLTLFPRPLTEPCSSVCVLGGNMEVGYACDPCNYLVHLKCIQPPQAIHQDHLADTSSLPPPTRRRWYPYRALSVCAPFKFMPGRILWLFYRSYVYVLSVCVCASA